MALSFNTMNDIKVTDEEWNKWLHNLTTKQAEEDETWDKVKVLFIYFIAFHCIFATCFKHGITFFLFLFFVLGLILGVALDFTVFLRISFF